MSGSGGDCVCDGRCVGVLDGRIGDAPIGLPLTIISMSCGAKPASGVGEGNGSPFFAVGSYWSNFHLVVSAAESDGHGDRGADIGRWSVEAAVLESAGASASGDAWGSDNVDGSGVGSRVCVSSESQG